MSVCDGLMPSDMGIRPQVREEHHVDQEDRNYHPCPG